MKTIFETVSFHLVKPCNMSCKFCYATYDTFGIKQQLRLEEVTLILEKLWEAGVKKVTFAGGEPMLYPHLDKVIEQAYLMGFITSIITNGSMITERWLDNMEDKLDCLGVSIDSFKEETLRAIGRVDSKGRVMNYEWLLGKIRERDFKLKINTVVNAYNHKEDMKTLINYFKPERWKVFEALKVVGQNENQFEEIRVGAEEYRNFVQNHKGCKNMVVETNELLTGSYLLIDPMGRFYENWGENNRKSDSLLWYSVNHCLEQINLNRDAFLERGGIYQW